MSDHDLSALLPEPPPPRPAARDAAIAAAMRRFDGEPAVAPARATPASPRFNRPQLAAFATIALVAVVGLPVWLAGDHRLDQVPSDVAVQAPAPKVAERQAEPTSAADMAAVPAPVVKGRAAPKVAPAEPVPAVVPTPSHEGDKGDWAVDTAALAPAPELMPPPAPAPAAVVAEPARKMAAAAPMASMDAENIVVTGSRVSAPAVARARVAPVRGDWNACTVSDPNRDLGACRTAIGASAPGAPGRAAAHVADGLLSAWQGDYSGAVSRFDRAIEITPGNATAYLNRGLAYARRGMSESAMADLDRAVRFAPSSPRGYYQRSLLLRRRGDAAGADADMRRAVELDPSYEVLGR